MTNKIIISAIIKKQDLLSTVSTFLVEHFKFHSECVYPCLYPLLEKLHDNMMCYIEYPYVENVFRDSYYHYYSTKHNAVIRDCMRISFFITEHAEPSVENIDLHTLQDAFCGYITIRPTLPNIIGTSLLSPKAYKYNDFSSCATISTVNINGVRFKVSAFPYASQDREYITCAETAIWCVMYYLGNKYNCYKSVLPSEILSALSCYSYESQLPSHGLAAEQICFVLKHFGLGIRLYAHNSTEKEDSAVYQSDVFKRLLGYYVESRIPIITSIENKSIGHAIVIIGNKNINHKQIRIRKYKSLPLATVQGDINLYDYVDFIDEYIVIDDNMPPYNNISFSHPTNNYTDKQFLHCEIKNIIVPMHHKIYLEAGGAKALVLSYLENFEHHLPRKNIIMRLVNISSNCFKSYIHQNGGIGEGGKDFILGISMPQFVWVALFTNPILLKKDLANGMVVLDATEINMEDAYICMLSPKGIITYDSQSVPENKYTKYDIPISAFDISINNIN